MTTNHQPTSTGNTVLDSLLSSDFSLKPAAAVPQKELPTEKIITLDIPSFPYPLPTMIETKHAGYYGYSYRQPKLETFELGGFLDSFRHSSAPNAKLISQLIARLREYFDESNEIDTVALFTALGTPMAIQMARYTYSIVSPNTATQPQTISPYAAYAKPIFQAGHSGLVLVEKISLTGRITTDDLPIEAALYTRDQQTLFIYMAVISFAYSLLRDSKNAPITEVMDAGAETVIINALKALKRQGLGAKTERWVEGKNGELVQVIDRRRVIALTPKQRQSAVDRARRAIRTLSSESERERYTRLIETAKTETRHYKRILQFFDSYSSSNPDSETEQELWNRACKNA